MIKGSITPDISEKTDKKKYPIFISADWQKKQEEEAPYPIEDIAAFLINFIRQDGFIFVYDTENKESKKILDALKEKVPVVTFGLALGRGLNND